jgi:diguanylate cyclase (GGDEF)-like protein
VVAEAVAELSHQALTAVQPEELLRKSLQMAVELIGADYGTAVRRHPDGQLSVAHELGPEPLAPGTVLPLAPERSYVLRVIGTGEPFVSADLRRDPRVAPPGPLLDRGVVSGLAVPIRGADSVMGALALHSRHQRRFSRDDVAAANALASVVATAWEQAAQRERLHQQALHDPLTELPNRTLFLDRLEHVLSARPGRTARPSDGVAVMLVDLDDFKAVNDGFGHATGDHLLRVAAQRLGSALRSHDTLARLGGDEYAVLCESLPDERTAVELAHRMKSACDGRVETAGPDVALSASIGLVWRDVTVARRRGAAGLLAEADAALYQAKGLGGQQVQVFDRRLEHYLRHRRQVEEELELALRRDELRLHYQPVRRTRDLKVVGIEALVRWQHPGRGLLMPGDFIPVAEQTGLVVPLGQWVLETACRQTAQWQQRGSAADPPLWVAVNLSPRQLGDPGLVEAVAAAQRESGLRPGTLALELTESALLPAETTHDEALAGLRDVGARLFLDDFGTGYSSLTHLTRLPFDTVKIDRSFVAGLPGSRRHAAVVSALVRLGRDLGLSVIAEGVECPRQLRALQLLGCPSVQGFLNDLPTADPDLG